MAHLSENSKRLSVAELIVNSREQLLSRVQDFQDVCVLRLPAYTEKTYGYNLEGVDRLVLEVARALGSEATLIVLGEPMDLVHVQTVLSSQLRYQLWIAIKRNSIQFSNDQSHLPQHHFGALIYTKYDASLRHTKMRIQYAYCPVCNKTTKDYGGKKHTYHEFGTLISDVWRDVVADLEGDLTSIIDRFSDLFGIDAYYHELRVLDCQKFLRRFSVDCKDLYELPSDNGMNSNSPTSRLIVGDCLKELKRIPDDSVDFAFADPPYNLKKKYVSYSDDLKITDYFAWCDEWIHEIARILRPGRTCAILNIPLWATRHFLCLERILKFQNWVVWDALSFPVRLIMPSHYAILCFSKGSSRKLPGLTNVANTNIPTNLDGTKFLKPLAENYCLREYCIEDRRKLRLNDRGMLTDLWWDIHRLKHNSRRADHPCQLPPSLMYRLISFFTKPGEVVLDCFDGAGTTTLAAHQLERKYIGIEISKQYYELAKNRHEEILIGLDPFRKIERILTAKNSPVPRMPKQKYAVPKKILQLEVKRIASLIGHLPTREELKQHGKYPIEYYNKYFTSWGEVCAAARTTGMSEDRVPVQNKSTAQQLELFVMESRAKYRVTPKKRSERVVGLPKTARKTSMVLLRKPARDHRRQAKKLGRF